MPAAAGSGPPYPPAAPVRKARRGSASALRILAGEALEAAVHVGRRGVAARRAHLHVGAPPAVTRHVVRRDFTTRLVAVRGWGGGRPVALRVCRRRSRLLPAEVNRFTHLDQHDRVALVAVDRQDRIQAVGRYDRLPGTDEAEVAFVVADEMQGQGLGRELLARLAPIAREEGIRRLVAETLLGNHPMLKVFRASGLAPRTRLADGVMHVTMDLDGAGREPTPDQGQTPSRGTTSEK